MSPSAPTHGVGAKVGRVALPYVALTGNPNCGKTTVFNALTGMRARVGNYAGVTVERKEGRLLGKSAESPVVILDLPGTYSLSPQSLDEQVSRDVMFHRLKDVPAPQLVVVVVDASNLQRNLYYATQVIELGYPTLVVLNMMDVAVENGHEIDPEQLSSALGAPVLPVVASKGQGIPELKRRIRDAAKAGTRRTIPRTFCELPEAFGREIETVSAALQKQFPQRHTSADAEALLVLTDEKLLAKNADHYSDTIVRAVTDARKRLEAAGADWRSVAIEARYARVAAIQQAVTTEAPPPGENFSDRVDRIVTHKWWGSLIFVGIMFLMFESIFWLAGYPMHAIEWAQGKLGNWVGGMIPPGDLHSLLVDGVIKGAGAVVIFLPQIILLFLFIALLEDTGYMSRAAFLMDRVMSRVGLHGKSFIPMLSSFACAIPGIMATRTIESPKDRLATILVAPLMSCSARLPVYTLLIGACIPGMNFLGIFNLRGLTMLAMYLLGIVGAMGMAWVFKRSILKGEPPMLIMELAPYKRPLVSVVLRHMWDRSRMFLKRAGTVILGINIILWFLATYPKSTEINAKFETQRLAAAQAVLPDVSAINLGQKLDALRTKFTADQAVTNVAEAALVETLGGLDHAKAGELLRYSFAGRMGLAIEPLIKPLGYDWKIGIGIIGSFAAREVFVSTMSTVYNLGGDDSEEGMSTLEDTLKSQTRPDGTVVYTPLLAVSLMVFYVFALQCVSTVAVVRRETNSWKWPLFQWAYMLVLAWGLAFVTYQGGRLLGWQ
jgi:ferrous iron transport protein B